jgi:formylglycine-generating enzyme required for sulfatase activity
VPEGRLAFPPHDGWQDRRVRLPGFALDETEVTIARLRSYVEWAEGRPPAPGLGAVAAIAGSGWNPAWDEKVSLDVVSEQLRLSLTDRCEVPNGRGGQVEYEDESVRPANCISWYTALSLCLSEGGRLPTLAEWTYAAEGGRQGRLYPWGDDAPTQEHVAMACLGDGTSGCSALDLLDVGSRPLGAGRWGHLDLAGSLEEWTLDALTNGAVSHWIRSSGFELEASSMPVRADLYGRGDDSTGWYLGARCLGE